MTETVIVLPTAYCVLAATYVLLLALMLAVALTKKWAENRLLRQGKSLPSKQVSLIKVTIVGTALGLIAALPAAADLWLQTAWLTWGAVAAMVLPCALCIGAAKECRHMTNGE